MKHVAKHHHQYPHYHSADLMLGISCREIEFKSYDRMSCHVLLLRNIITIQHYPHYQS